MNILYYSFETPYFQHHICHSYAERSQELKDYETQAKQIKFVTAQRRLLCYMCFQLSTVYLMKTSI